MPRRVGVGLRRLSAGPQPSLQPEEEQALGPRAVERRRQYFAAGRAAARDALRELGVVHDVAIGRGASGEPLWPEGIVGAISHAGDFAVAVAGLRADYAGLGVDVEELSHRLNPRIARLICRPDEMEWVDI